MRNPISRLTRILAAIAGTSAPSPLMQQILYRLYLLSHRLWRWLNRRFTPTGLFVVFCTAIAGLTGVDTNLSVIYQIFTFLVALLGVAIADSWRFRLRFHSQRLLPRFGTVGMPLRYRIVIHNDSSQRQDGLLMREDFPPHYPSDREFREIAAPFESRFGDRAWGYRRWRWLLARKQIASGKAIDLPTLPPGGKIEVNMELLPLRRGILRLEQLSLLRPDLLGLYYARQTTQALQTIAILPKRYQLPPLRLPGNRRYQSGGVALASSVGDSEEFRALREYRPGDSPRKIHWKSWAKIGKPIVKEEQDEFFVRHALILDTFQRDAESEILEEAIAVAASFACEVQTQESLLELMFVGLEAYSFTFGRGLGQTDRMLEILAAVVACQDKSFDTLVPVVLHRLSFLSGCICVFLAWDESRRNLVRHLQSLRIPTLAIAIAARKESIEGFDVVGSDGLTQGLILELGKIQEGLMTLS